MIEKQKNFNLKIRRLAFAPSVVIKKQLKVKKISLNERIYFKLNSLHMWYLSAQIFLEALMPGQYKYMFFQNFFAPYIMFRCLGDKKASFGYLF